MVVPASLLFVYSFLLFIHNSPNPHHANLQTILTYIIVILGVNLFLLSGRPFRNVNIKKCCFFFSFSFSSSKSWVGGSKEITENQNSDLKKHTCTNEKEQEELHVYPASQNRKFNSRLSYCTKLFVW